MGLLSGRPFQPYDDETSKQFMKELNEGYVPKRSKDQG